MTLKTPILIFVEGKEDKRFLQDFIDYHFGLQLDKEIIEVGGYTKLHLIVNKFQTNSDKDGINLLIFDADSDDNGGGFENRLAYFEAKKSELSIQFETFLFPNNRDDGDFETLLENIINPKHQGLLDCFENYENCLKQYMNENGNPIYVLPNRKAKIYAYFESFPKNDHQMEEMKNKKNWLYKEQEFWNIQADYVQPLKDFLTLYLSQPKS